MDVAAAEQLVDLAVGDDHLALALGPEHGLLHHFVPLNAPAVIGEAAHHGGHALDIRQLLALFAHGDGTVGIDMDAGVGLDDGALEIQVLHAVRHRI